MRTVTMNAGGFTALTVGLAAAGFAAGYILASNRVRNETMDRVDEAINETKDFYERLNKTGPYATVSSAAKKLVGDDVVEEETTSEPEDGVGTEVVEQIIKEEHYNLFDQDDLHEPERGDDAPSKEERLSPRGEGMPYVISEGEWTLQERNYEQAQVTYYEADNTLADDRDAIIPNIDDTVGLKNLNLFDKGLSDNKDVLFIRNEALELDLEVLRDEGSYTEKILGIREDPEDEVVRTRKRRDERDD